MRVLLLILVEFALAFAVGAFLLYRAMRAGKAAFPRSDAFQRAATVFDHRAIEHRGAYYLLALRTFSFLWNVAVLAQAYATIPRLVCSTHAPCAMLHFDLTGKPSNLAKFTVWNYHLQTAFWLLAATASFRHVLTGNGTRAQPVVRLLGDPQATHLQAPLTGPAEESSCSNGSSGGGGSCSNGSSGGGGGSGGTGGSGGGDGSGSSGGGSSGSSGGYLDAFLGVTVPTLLSVCVPTSVLVSGVFW